MEMLGEGCKMPPLVKVDLVCSYMVSFGSVAESGLLQQS